jgi:hypothetical protein
MSEQRLAVLAAARLKATEVRRARAQERAEEKELERLEREAKRRDVQKRTGELRSRMFAQGERSAPQKRTPEPEGPCANEPRPAPRLAPRPKRQPAPPPVSQSSEEEEEEWSDEPEAPRPSRRHAVAHDATHRLQKLREDMLFKSLFG